MRVLIIAQYFPPDMGGGATRAFNAAQGLSIAGCDVTVVAAFPHYPTGSVPHRYRWKPYVIEEEGAIKVIRTFVPPVASKGYFRRMLLFLSFAISSLLPYLHIGPIDLVWVANPNITAMFSGAFYSRLKNCSIVQNIDDLWPEVLFEFGVKPQSLLGRIATFFALLAYRLADAFTPISSAYSDVIVEKYGIPQSRIFEVKAGVDLDRFPTMSSEKKSDRYFRVLYIGAFSPAYDFQQVFDAASILEGEDVEFIIQGGGELAADLVRASSEMQLGSLSIVNKIVDRSEVAVQLCEADALLLPLGGSEIIELGISSKLYEYQASGRPIICISKGQPGRYIQESMSGVIIPPRNPDALAKAILHLRDNRDVGAQLGMNGRRYVEQNLSIERIGVRLKRIFELIGNAEKRTSQ